MARKGKSKSRSKRGLFYSPPKNKEVAKHISIATLKAAQDSIKWLKQQIENKKLDVGNAVKYAVLAANRAKASLNRKNLSKKERKEFKEVFKIFRDFVDKHKKT